MMIRPRNQWLLGFMVVCAIAFLVLNLKQLRLLGRSEFMDGSSTSSSSSSTSSLPREILSIQNLKRMRDEQARQQRERRRQSGANRNYEDDGQGEETKKDTTNDVDTTTTTTTKTKTKTKRNNVDSWTKKGKKQTTKKNNDEHQQQQQQQHVVAGLNCDKYGGPSNDIAAEMVYWRDIPKDATYESPFQRLNTPENPKYLTFEPVRFSATIKIILVIITKGGNGDAGFFFLGSRKISTHICSSAVLFYLAFASMVPLLIRIYIYICNVRIFTG